MDRNYFHDVEFIARYKKTGGYCNVLFAITSKLVKNELLKNYIENTSFHCTFVAETAMK